MKIRQEKTEDFKEVYELVKESFATSTHADGTEPDYLNEVRKKVSFIPELSLVVENDGRSISNSKENGLFCCFSLRKSKFLS